MGESLAKDNVCIPYMMVLAVIITEAHTVCNAVRWNVFFEAREALRRLRLVF